MKRWLLLLLLIVAACGSPAVEDVVLQEKEVPMESPKPVLENVEPSEVTFETEPEMQVEEPTPIPDEIEPMYCVKLQNMTIEPEEALPENIAIAIAVGTDSTKKGVYDLGYYNKGIFRIGRQGLKTQGVPISIKLRGPGSITSEPMRFTWTCDNRTHETFLPAMNQDIIFYVDSYARLYWRDDQMDGTGNTMDALKALEEQYRYLEQ